MTGGMNKSGQDSLELDSDWWMFIDRNKYFLRELHIVEGPRRLVVDDLTRNFDVISHY